ncbi:hypothetical protein JCM9279_001307 [Rhodotorula babjevae]
MTLLHRSSLLRPRHALLFTLLAPLLAIIVLRFRLPTGPLAPLAHGMTSTASAAAAARPVPLVPRADAGELPAMSDPFVLRPAAGVKHTGTVIWSHGLGDTAQGWKSFAQALTRVQGLEGIKWVLTNAPKRFVTVNNAEMSSWYDIVRPNAPAAEEDTDGMAASVQQLEGLVKHEVDEEGVKEGRVVVGGFSQGGVISLLAGLTSPRQLGGVCVLSGFLGLTHDDKIKSHLSPTALKTPILWAHGTADSVISFDRAQSGRRYLVDELKLDEGGKVDGGREGKFKFSAHAGMGHQLGSQEYEEVKAWLVERFARS